MSWGALLKVGSNLLSVEEAGRRIEAEAMPESQSTDSLEDIQRQQILRVLERTGWVISGPKGAGAILNVHPNTLRSLMKRLGIRLQAVPRTRRGLEFFRPANDACPGSYRQFRTCFATHDMS